MKKLLLTSITALALALTFMAALPVPAAEKPTFVCHNSMNVRDAKVRGYVKRNQVLIRWPSDKDISGTMEISFTRLHGVPGRKWPDGTKRDTSTAVEVSGKDGYEGDIGECK